jgi:hypothetical protein
MRVTEQEYAEILKRSGVRGAESGRGPGGKNSGAQGAKKRNEQAGDDRATDTATNMEPHTGDESLGAQEAQGYDSRCCLHVHSVRATLADPDGVSAKAAIDGLIHGGVLQDDSSKQIQEVTYSQEKCKKGQEKTIITLSWND